MDVEDIEDFDDLIQHFIDKRRMGEEFKDYLSEKAGDFVEVSLENGEKLKGYILARSDTHILLTRPEGNISITEVYVVYIKVIRRDIELFERCLKIFKKKKDNGANAYTG